MPDMWGQAIEVPESKFQFIDRLSNGSKVGEDIGGQAAKMLTPGAVMSGYKEKEKERKRRIIVKK